MQISLHFTGAVAEELVRAVCLGFFAAPLRAGSPSTRHELQAGAQERL